MLAIFLPQTQTVHFALAPAAGMAGFVRFAKSTGMQLVSCAFSHKKHSVGVRGAALEFVYEHRPAFLIDEKLQPVVADTAAPCRLPAELLDVSAVGM